MIDQALVIITKELNQFLKIRFDLNEDKVLLSPLVDQDGSVATQDENKIILTLFDVSEETTLKNGLRYREDGDGLVSKRPDLHLNLQVLFSSYFNALNYTDSLKYLSAVIGFFHAKPSFDVQNTPEMVDSGIDRLVFEIFHQDSNTKNNLWASIGAKYLPSILYKIRVITIADDSIRQQIDRIYGVDLHDEPENLK